MKTISGNIVGLKPSQHRALERTYHRRVVPNRILGIELARHLAWIAHEVGREIGVLVNRSGHIEYTFVGEPQRIYLPDIGRQRVGQGHLRGLRHIHTVFAGGLNDDDFADLTKLRLDLVCTLKVNETGEPGELEYAHLLPSNADIPYHKAKTRSIHELDIDFKQLIASLEEEISRVRGHQQKGKDKIRAVIVGVYADRNTADWRLTEIRELANTAGVHIEDTVIQLRRQVDAKYIVGKGKLEEVVLRCLDVDAGLIIVDHNMTPAQARAIASTTELKVIDRTQLILDIFAQHAKSRDGKLQVELAQLKYNLPRLTDLDAGLSRLTGGIGGRGPGETKLEINRRRARERINRLEREINKISRTRSLRRSLRIRSALPTVSIVGYTNAGKSTLLNRLTRSDVLVANQLFATLDPTSRRLRFPAEREAIITDTVGFIRDLPADLLRAFRATLEELENADLLLHVIDITDPMHETKSAVVLEVLHDLQLDGITRITVYNKADLLPHREAMLIATNRGIAVSAITGFGLDTLINKVAHRLWQTWALSENDAWAQEA
ncbi:MAG: GTPase HflX, partial [Deltaproteobacteria bacterium]|nr:GTPase HflX [Deltaproteobacteria bacterium]